MNLPDLALQIGYGRIGWAVVVAATIVHFWPSARPLAARQIGMIVGAALLAAMLPGPASFAYWLGLVCQYPSGLLVGCCVASLRKRTVVGRGRYRLPASLAVVLPPVGALLYLDAMGLLTHGYYFWGFSAVVAPVVALLATVGCVISVARQGMRPSTLAMFIALALFTVLRLPTGSLWDALLDPLLWVWSCVALAALLKKTVSRRRTLPVLSPIAAPAAS